VGESWQQNSFKKIPHRKSTQLKSMKKEVLGKFSSMRPFAEFIKKRKKLNVCVCERERERETLAFGRIHSSKIANQKS
jgi:hypothetical protein